MKKNIQNTLFLVALAAIIGFFSLSYIFVEEKGFSEEENRVLQTTPRFTISKLLDGTYTAQLHDYFSDQINLRSFMIGMKAYLELAMGKNENNGILYGKDGYLIESYQYTDEELQHLDKNMSRIEALSERLAESGVTVSSVIIPRKVDVLTDKLPPHYSNERNKAVYSHVGSSHLTLTEVLKNAEARGVETFYRTDHHWTADGAYEAYVALSDVLGFSPVSKVHFDIQSLSNQFFGTTYSTSGFFLASPDTISAPRLDEGRYTVRIEDTDTLLDGLYDTSYLAKKDKYSLFLSGNNAHVTVTDTENTEKEKLLLIKDSYSHSLAPYLAEHYDLELIDPRYFSGSIEDYIKESGIQNVLFIFGLDTLASASLSIR